MRRITLGIISASAAMTTLAAVPSTAFADQATQAVSAVPSGQATQATVVTPSDATDTRTAVSISAFKATYTPYGKLTLSGEFVDSTTGGGLPRPALSLEYSLNGKTDWTAQKQLKAGDSSDFTTTFQQNQSGWWRATFVGNEQYQPATSAIAKAWRWRTELSKIKMSPTKVRKNRSVTASGRLIRWTKARADGYRGYSGQKVRIIFRFKGKKTWYHLGWAKTDSKGYYKMKVKAHGDGYYAAEFEGGKDTFASSSPNEQYVNTVATKSGGTIAVSALPGAVVVLRGVPSGAGGSAITPQVAAGRG